MADPPILPLSGRSSLRSQIYESLRSRLQRSEIQPDERLVDVDIAATLGVSRMPVREALLQLVNEGYLVGTTRGFTLPRLTLADIADIFEIRKLIEPHAAATAARHLSADGEQALRRALAQAVDAVRASDVAGLAVANVLFRQTWLEAVRNRRLAATIQRFADHVQTVRFATLHDRATRKIVVDGLAALVDAFARRHPKDTEARMAAFIGNAEARFFAVRATAEESDGARPRAGRSRSRS